MRVVFDTNVFVSALIGGSAPRALLELWTRTRPFELVVSPNLLAELTDVLGRQKLRRWIRIEDANALVDRLQIEAIEVKDHYLAEPVSADPDDDYLIALARAANADCIVSGDADLTGLVDPEPAVLTPADFLATLDRP